MMYKFFRGFLIGFMIAGAILAGCIIGVKAFNQSGTLTRQEPFSFWTSVTLSDSTQYGPINGTKAIDGVFLNATAGQTLVVVDQNSNQVTWTFGTAGTYFLPISPAKFPSTGGGTATGIIAVYK
jgi:hypothetical protein